MRAFVGASEPGVFFLFSKKNAGGSAARHSQRAFRSSSSSSSIVVVSRSVRRPAGRRRCSPSSRLLRGGEPLQHPGHALLHLVVGDPDGSDGRAFQRGRDPSLQSDQTPLVADREGIDVREARKDEAGPLRPRRRVALRQREPIAEEEGTAVVRRRGPEEGLGLFEAFREARDGRIVPVAALAGLQDAEVGEARGTADLPEEPHPRSVFRRFREEVRVREPVGDVLRHHEGLREDRIGSVVLEDRDLRPGARQGIRSRIDLEELRGLVL
mmetsp:Transcript_15979/g.37008  ORF Transcript_15979/g.37008 Transcript_15979/m.37008 type:complete len:269 (-) Transcript_15979:313-1119(-)